MSWTCVSTVMLRSFKIMPPPPRNLYNVERVQNESLQSLDFQSWRTLMGDDILYHPTCSLWNIYVLTIIFCHGCHMCVLWFSYIGDVICRKYCLYFFDIITFWTSQFPKMTNNVTIPPSFPHYILMINYDKPTNAFKLLISTNNIPIYDFYYNICLSTRYLHLIWENSL